MKITKQQLRQIIKEELENINEDDKPQREGYKCRPVDPNAQPDGTVEAFRWILEDLNSIKKALNII